MTGTTASASHSQDPMSVLGLRQLGYSSLRDILERIEADKSTAANFKRGHYNRVFAVPGTNQYVLRAPFAVRPDTPIELVADPLPDRNVSQVLAREGALEILRKQAGITGGVPFHDLIHPGANGDRAYRQYVAFLAQRPQRAFDHLAETLIALTSVGYIYDYSHARNLMIDDAEINVVDIAPRPAEVLTLGEMASSLLDTIYRWRTSCQFDDLQELIRAIVDRAIQAAVRTGLPMPQLKGEPTRFEEHYRMEYVFALAGRKGEWPAVRESLLARKVVT